MLICLPILKRYRLPNLNILIHSINILFNRFQIFLEIMVEYFVQEGEE